MEGEQFHAGEFRVRRYWAALPRLLRPHSLHLLALLHKLCLHVRSAGADRLVECGAVDLLELEFGAHGGAGEVALENNGLDGRVGESLVSGRDGRQALRRGLGKAPAAPLFLLELLGGSGGLEFLPLCLLLESLLLGDLGRLPLFLLSLLFLQSLRLLRGLSLPLCLPLSPVLLRFLRLLHCLSLLLFGLQSRPLLGRCLPRQSRLLLLPRLLLFSQSLRFLFFPLFPRLLGLSRLRRQSLLLLPLPFPSPPRLLRSSRLLHRESLPLRILRRHRRLCRRSPLSHSSLAHSLPLSSRALGQRQSRRLGCSRSRSDSGSDSSGVRHISGRALDRIHSRNLLRKNDGRGGDRRRLGRRTSDSERRAISRFLLLRRGTDGRWIDRGDSWRCLFVRPFAGRLASLCDKGSDRGRTWTTGGLHLCKCFPLCTLLCVRFSLLWCSLSN
mmetsp:Transcript_7972/g.33557  ORF Transcript_7972/g.33557 Transcript_7972/m.33557 type:complete len:442 (+) Transcript_7972:1203-2528(+)